MNAHFPPSTLPHPIYRVVLTVGDHSAYHLRRIARLLLKEWQLEELTDKVELALTELVTNVYRHTGDRHCTIVFTAPHGAVRVEVTDTSPQLPTLHTDFNPNTLSGRGLLLLDAVADKWDVIHPTEEGGKTVWFECARIE